MSNVVKFLEALGQNPEPMSEDAIADLATGAELDTEILQAIAAGDTSAIVRALDVTPTICSMLFPAEDDDNKKDNEDGEGDRENEERESSSLAA